MGWNNGANSNQLNRPEASRLLTGAPADINKCKELFNNLPAGVDSGRIPASDSMNGSDAEAALSDGDRSEPGSKQSELETLLEEL
jgi:hypothetical protein